MSTAVKSSPRNLPKLSRPRLVTFDAFGTLYEPREDVPSKYASLVKDHCGIDVRPEVLRNNFGSSMKRMVSEHPHYGKYTLLDPERQNTSDSSSQLYHHVREWWESVIKQTFEPIELPADTLVMLYDYYSSAEAYQVYADVVPLLKSLVEKDHIPVALISNSDPRFDLVLKDLGLSQYFENKVFLSYHTGFEKPDPRIFTHVQDNIASNVTVDGNMYGGYCWHIGDELEKDCRAAAEVPGWKGILIDRTGSQGKGQLGDNQLIVGDLRQVRELFLNLADEKKEVEEET